MLPIVFGTKPTMPLSPFFQHLLLNIIDSKHIFIILASPIMEYPLSVCAHSQCMKQNTLDPKPTTPLTRITSLTKNPARHEDSLIAQLVLPPRTSLYKVLQLTQPPWHEAIHVRFFLILYHFFPSIRSLPCTKQSFGLSTRSFTSLYTVLPSTQCK